MKFRFVASAFLALAIPAAAHAAPTVTFDGTCKSTASSTQAKCTSVAGAAGAVTIQGTNDATLKVMITAWQANQATSGPNAGKITAANLGAFDGGFGVTGTGDQNGANNYHQMDNAGGYTDIIMLQFSRAVQLTSATLNEYGIDNPYGSGNSTDSDMSYLALSPLIAVPAQWNSTINLATFVNNTALWTQNDGTGDRTATLNTSVFSQVWLISAAQLPTNDRDDAFKLKNLVVNATPAVPEPATWAMLMVGFGAIGATLRRRRDTAAPALA